MFLAQLLVTLLTLSGCPTNGCGDHFTISGTVTDKESKAPVVGANVFIAGSQLGSNTDDKGYFEINGIEIEAFQLIFSHVGYEVRTINFDLRRSSKRLDLSLKPKSTSLEEVVVSSKKDRKWNRDLKKFKQFFFGEQFSEELINIENDYLIEFMDRRGRDLIVDNKPGLEIRNNYLGYDIYYQLLKFELAEIKTYMGFPRFTEQETEDSARSGLWQENRKTAYNGSIRHFFHELLNNRLDESGYGVALLPKFRMMDMSMQVVSEKEALRLTDDGIYKKNITIKKLSNQTYEVSFKGKLEVTYFDEFDEYGDPQSSEILLNDVLLIHKNGVVLNPGAMVAFGYWTKEGLYELLPFEYNPNQK